MAGEEELKIKITGDPSSFQKAADAVIGGLEKLSESVEKASKSAGGLLALEGLQKVADVSKEAFETVKSTIEGSIEAYGEAEKATRQLSLSLQNQGIYSEELSDHYKEYAESVSRLTGIQADEIASSQTVLQGFLGQRQVTQELTQATADLAAEQGVSLTAAAQELGKAIQSGTGQLKKMGLQLADTDSEAQRYQKTLDFVKLRAGGFAESANQGVGAIKGLRSAIQDSREELGEKFAPAFEFAVKALTSFIQPAEDGNEELTNLKASLLVAAGVLTSIGVVLPIVGQAVIILKTAVAAFNLELNATKIALASIGIGLIIIALTELYLHWDSISSKIKVVVAGLTVFVTESFSGIGKLIAGVATANLTQLKEGFVQIKGAFAAGMKAAEQAATAEVEDGGKAQNAAQKKFADEAAALRKFNDDARIAEGKAIEEQSLLIITEASKKRIDLKKEEGALYGALQKAQNGIQRAAILAQINETKKLYAQEREEDLAREIQFEQIKQRTELNANVRLQAINTDASKKEIAAIKAKLLTESEAEVQFYEKKLARQVEANNKFLADQAEFGTAYAAINDTLRSEEITGFQEGTSQLVGLTNSKQQTLKEIGRAAAVADITIKTAQGALAAYAGFAAIPIIGIPLGLLAGAAVIAYGAEQIATVTSAADGGVLTGGIPGVDSVPVLGMPGELVVPTRNFEEVVGATRAARSGANEEMSGHLEAISAKLDQRPPGITIMGDFFGEKTMIQKLIKGINNSVLYNNAQLRTRPGGVTGQ